MQRANLRLNLRLLHTYWCRRQAGVAGSVAQHEHDRSHCSSLCNVRGSSPSCYKSCGCRWLPDVGYMWHILGGMCSVFPIDSTRRYTDESLGVEVVWWCVMLCQIPQA